jgi:hypothetical protein
VLFADNGEFACGEILKACLTKVEGFNVLVCVSRHVDGMFVTDMLQTQKHRAVKEAAARVIELLKDHLTNAGKKVVVDEVPALLPRDSFYFDSKKVRIDTPELAPSRPASGKRDQQWRVDS